LHAGEQSIHWSYYKKIHSGCNQQEGDGLIDQIADLELAAADGERKGCEVPGLSHDRANQRGEKVFRESTHHGGEGGADDDADGHVDYVAAKDEFLEAVQHVSLPEIEVADTLMRVALRVKDM
jgi:hypothetical protein